MPSRGNNWSTVQGWGRTYIRAERGELSRVPAAQGLIEEASGAL